MTEPDACHVIVAPLSHWLRLTVGAEWMGCYLWDRAVGQWLPVYYDGDPSRRHALVDPDVLSVIRETAAGSQELCVDPLKADGLLGAFARGGLTRLHIFPFTQSGEPLGVLLIGNADPDRLAHHRTTVEAIGPSTLLALRSCWEARQLTLQTQELQREKDYLQTLLKGVQQRQLMIEELTHELEKTKGSLEAVLEHCPVGLICVDRTGAIQSANAPAVELLNHPLDLIINRRLADLVPTALQQEVDTLLQRALRGESVNAVELAWPKPQETRTIMLTLHPFHDENGRILGVVGTLPDLTDDIRMRNELSRSEKLAAMGELIAGVAHEMNNPLTSVLGYASLLLRNATDPKVREPLETITKEAERTSRIVKNLLLYARQHQPERRATHVNELLDEVIRERAESLAASHITVDRVYDPSIDRVYVDPFQLQQVLLNLITNAEQAIADTRRDGRLTFRTRVDRSAGQVVIQVEDNGSGIPAQHLSRVFDPFFTTKEVGTGTGLGLSICYGIVKEHGGTISAYNTPHGGAVFTITLPVGDGEAVKEVAAEAAASDALTGKKILVVDDEPHIRRFFEQALGPTHSDVEIASTVSEAIEKVRRHAFDVVIYDYRLPDGTGQELAREILAIDPKLANRMLLITGDSLTPETDAYLKKVPHALMKPFDLAALQAALRNMLTAPETAPTSR
ncbi:MAG TPA: ATP-binding protein [Methylomirabilota bacterium]|nr:ATP-binding protein [Methylomirabilota bacterium]